jgi:hypothetical protein
MKTKPTHFGPPEKTHDENGAKINRTGSPLYTDKIGREICGRIATGQSLKKIASLPGMPHQATILSWLNREGMENFRERYDRARRAWADSLFEEILEDAEGVTTENAHAKRVQIDTKKWAASKLAPKAYGERLDVNVSGRVDHVHAAKEAPEWLRERLKERPKVIEGTATEVPDAAPQPKPPAATTH